MGGRPVGPQARREYLARMRDRYPMANRAKRSQLVNEAAITGWISQATCVPSPRNAPASAAALACLNAGAADCMPC